MVATASGDHHRMCRFGRDCLSQGRVSARLSSMTPCAVHEERSPVLAVGYSTAASSWKMLASESGTSPPGPGGEAQARRACRVWVGILSEDQDPHLVEGQLEGAPDDRVRPSSTGRYGPASATFAKQASSLESMPASTARRPATQSAAILPSPARRSRICAESAMSPSVLLSGPLGTGLGVTCTSCESAAVGAQGQDGPHQTWGSRPTVSETSGSGAPAAPRSSQVSTPRGSPSTWLTTPSRRR